MGVTSKSVRLPVQKVQHWTGVATDLWFWSVCSGNALYPCARALFFTGLVRAPEPIGDMPPRHIPRQMPRIRHRLTYSRSFHTKTSFEPPENCAPQRFFN